MVENMSDMKYWMGFNIVKGIGPVKVQALIDRFDDLALAWEADESELKAIGFDKRAIRSFMATRDEIDLDERMAYLERAGVKMTCWDSADYPNPLKRIPGSPPTLYIKGDLIEADKFAVAIVGTRKMTAYGREMTEAIATGLARNGVTIVSGLARGVDTVAHQAALDAGGRTIAVLASGIDHIYPPENRTLAAQIADGHGAIVTEHAPGVRPEQKNFPPRNRIISALALGSLIVEAGEKSGSLITANFAQEQGRRIFAVPGNVSNVYSRGSNALIQRGAMLTTSADDILTALNLKEVEEQKAVQMLMPDSAEEAALLPYLADGITYVPDLGRLTGMSAAMVTGTLTLMELKGAVRRIDQSNYAILRESKINYAIPHQSELKIEQDVW